MKAFHSIIVSVLVLGVTATIAFGKNGTKYEYMSGNEVVISGVAKTVKTMSREESRLFKTIELPTNTAKLSIGHGWDCTPATESIPFERCFPFLIVCPFEGEDCVKID